MKSSDRVRAVRRGVIALVVGIGLTLASCTPGKGSGADPTVPTAASTSSTAAPIDVSKIPATIDEPYVTAVLAAIDEVDGKATRLIYAAKKVTPEAAQLLSAIYSSQQLEPEVRRWVTALAGDPELKGIIPSPGSRKTMVERIIAATPACVWLAVRRDYSEVNVDPGPGRTEYVALQPLDRSNNPTGVNATAWAIGMDGFQRDGTEPANPCP